MSLQDEFNTVDEIDVEVSSIPKVDYVTPQVESNPIVYPPGRSLASVNKIDHQLCHIISGKENLPIEDVKSFVRLLKSDSDNVKLEAASSLLHVIRMNHASVVVECGAIPHLVNILKTSNSNVRDECAKCIEALVGTSTEIQNNIIQANGLLTLLDILDDSPTNETSQICVGVLSRLLCDKPRIEFAAIAPTLPRLVKLLDTENDPDMVPRISQILSDLCNGDTSCIQAVLDTGAKPKLTSLLTHQNETIVTSALRALRSLVPARNLSPSGDVSHSGRDNTFKRKLDYSKLLSPLKLISPSTRYPTTLSKLEIITCQNVEFFQGIKAETAGDKMVFEAVGRMQTEQVGLRCIHCGHIPLAKAYFSKCFPRNISSIAASLYHMAAEHFTKCTRTPYEIGSKFRHFVRVMEQDSTYNNQENTIGEKATSSEAPLNLFCVNLCEHTGIENASPPKSGLIYTRTLHEEQRLPQKRCDTIVHNAAFNTLATSTGNSHPLPSYEYDEHYRGGQYNQDERATPPYPYQHGMVHDTSVVEGNDDFRLADFVQDQHGTWRCHYCFSSPPEERKPGSSWYESCAPPRAFRDRHLKLCPFVSGYQTHQHGGSSHCEESFPSHSNYYNPQSFHHKSHSGWEPYPETHSYTNDPELGHHEHLAQFSHLKPGYTHIYPPPINHHHGVPLRSEVLHKLPEIKENQDNLQDHESLTRSEDKVLITQFLFNIISQLKICRFSESDVKTARGGIRVNIDIGFGGMQCIHCMNKNYPRKFFWSTVDRLANSFSEISNHVIKCKYIPDEIETYLKQLKLLHQDQMSHLPRGSQKIFFRRLWRRIHSEDPDPFIPTMNRADYNSKEICTNTEIVTNQFKTRDNNNIDDRNTSNETAKAFVGGCDKSLSSLKPILLGIDEDKDWLSENDCYLRQHIEVFCATSEITRAKGRHSKVPIGRVGLRCVHCAKSMDHKALPVSALFFPKKIDKIYTCVREFHQKHLKCCPSISREEKVRVGSFNGSVTMSIALRQYYVNSAKKLGMYDTSSGIRISDRNIATPTTKFNASSAVCSEESRVPASARISNSHVNTVTPLDVGKVTITEAMNPVWL